MRLASGDSVTIKPEGQAVSAVRLQHLEKKASACWVEVTYPHGWDGQAVSITYSALNPHGFRSRPDVIGGIGTQSTHTDTPIRWNSDGSITPRRQAAKMDAGTSALITLAGIPQATADSVAACASRNNPQSQNYGDCVTLVASLASEASQTLAGQVTAPASAPYPCQIMLGTPLEQIVTGWSDTLSTVPTMVGYGQAQAAASELQTGAPNTSLGFQAIAKDCGIQTTASTSPSSSEATGSQPSSGGQTSPTGVYDVQTVVAADEGAGALTAQPSSLGLSGDGTGRIKNLEWQTWGGSTAQGTGLLGINNCTPDCADGTFTWTQATITLSDIGLCLGQQAYLAYSLNGRPPAPLDFSNQCPDTSTESNSTVSSSGSPAPAKTWWGFRTPSGNIVCNSGGAVSCAVFSASTGSGQATWILHATGNAKFARIQGNIAGDVPTLSYGETWSRNGVSCNSEENGLTCRNGDGHGVFLSRESQRTF